MPTIPVVTDWGTAIMGSLTLALAMFMSFIPKLLGAAVILLVGWLIARVVANLVTRALRALHFNQIADRAEIDQFLASAGVRMDPAAVVAKLAYWFLLLIFVGAAFNAFGLPQVTDMVNRILAFIPNVVVAVVVLLLGALAANFVAKLVRGASSTAHLGDPNLIATLGRGAVLVFAALIALDQLHIAPAIINALWFAFIGMIAVAGALTFGLGGALAFGLGGRDVAKRLLEDWYQRSGKASGLITDPAQGQAPPATPTAQPAEPADLPRPRAA